MKIVIGLDDSPCSKAALDYVKKLARYVGTRAEVVVVSAVRSAVMAYAEVYVPALTSNEDVFQDRLAAGKELVAEAAQDLRNSGLSTSTRVVQGDPGDVLVQTAAEIGADLIVVGSHGRTGIAKLMLGSVATHVVTHARCNVLVVKADGSLAGNVR